MAGRTCTVCGEPATGALARFCQRHLRISEHRLLVQQRDAPSAWVLAVGPVERGARDHAQAEATDVELASVGRRFGAFVMDMVIATVMASMVVGSSVALGVFVWWGYFLVANTLGALIGKGVFGIKVVDARTGGEPGLGGGAMRTVGLALDFLTLSIGFLLALGSSRRALHDYVADTVVVRTQPRS